MSKEWVNLSQDIFTGMPHARAHGDINITSKTKDISDGFVLRTTHLDMPAHGGTHIDAANHFFPGAKSIDQYPPNHFIGPGVVLDLRREGAVPITVEDLNRSLNLVKEGDIALLCFGYGRRFTDDIYHEHPYLSVEAAEWLVAKGVRIVGVDVTTPDLPGTHRPEGFGFPVHRALLCNGVLIIENLGAKLELFAGRRVEVIAMPLPIKDSDASPISVLVKDI